MATPNPSQNAEIAFMTGVDTGGLTNAENFFTWSHNNPPTYGEDNSAHKWQGGTAGSSGGIIRYFFNPDSNWTMPEMDGWRSGMALWSAVANINFVQTTVPAEADLTISRNSDGAASENGAWSVVPTGSSELGKTSSSVITYDPIAYGAVNDFASRGGYGIGTVVHELGHTIGLGHGGPYDSDVVPGTQQLGPYDSRLWTTMSYIDANDASAKYFKEYPVTGTDWGASAGPFTWMPIDILAAQRLYGVAENTPLSGGQIFGFNCNISGPLNQYFNFLVDTHPVITLWDKGSGNTLDVSGFKGPSNINLNPGTFSSCDGMKNNIAIAYDTKIDKVVGGVGNDTFVVNDDGDTINGGSGTNTVVFAGSSTQYTVADNSGTITVTDGVAGRNGTDVLTNVRFLQFSNDTIDTQNLLPNAAMAQNDPNVAATSATLQNSNPDPRLDWQVANTTIGSATVTAQAASSGGTLLPNEPFGLLPMMANDTHETATAGVHVT